MRDSRYLAQKELSTLSVSPNPTSGLINIEIPDKLDAETVEVTDVKGTLLYTAPYRSELHFDVAPGMYIV